MNMRKILKYGFYGFLIYKFGWVVKIFYTSLKLITYLAPTIIYYGGVALLTI